MAAEAIDSPPPGVYVAHDLTDLPPSYDPGCLRNADANASDADVSTVPTVTLNESVQPF